MSLSIEAFLSYPEQLKFPRVLEHEELPFKLGVKLGLRLSFLFSILNMV